MLLKIVAIIYRNGSIDSTSCNALFIDFIKESNDEKWASFLATASPFPFLCMVSLHVTCLYYKVFKPEYHKSELFEFGNLHSESKQCSSNDAGQVTTTVEVFNQEGSERDQVQRNHELNKIEEGDTVVGHYQSASKPLHEGPPRYGCLYC